MSRKVHILCDGGLGNRLSGLIGGMITAQALKANCVISWPVNNWCGCEFDDLFESQGIMHNKLTVNDLLLPDNRNYIIHENQTQQKLVKCFAHALTSLEQLGTTVEDVVYYHNKLMPYHDQNSVIEHLSKLPIKISVLGKVKQFCDQNQINSHTIGLHLRKTENRSLDDTFLLEEVRTNVHKKYFVCSDDQATEQKFSQFSNVVVNAKSEYVAKMTHGDWYETLVDSNGRPTKYNIQRSRQSVIEAFEDMLILSRCWIKPTVKSSFSSFARYFSQLDL